MPEKGSVATASAPVVFAGTPPATLKVTAEEMLHLLQCGTQTSAKLRCLPSPVLVPRGTYTQGNVFLTGYFFFSKKG